MAPSPLLPLPTAACLPPRRPKAPLPLFCGLLLALALFGLVGTADSRPTEALLGTVRGPLWRPAASWAAGGRVAGLPGSVGRAPPLRAPGKEVDLHPTPTLPRDAAHRAQGQVTGLCIAALLGCAAGWLGYWRPVPAREWVTASVAGVSKEKLAAVQRQITEAIQFGAPLYNAGDVAGCAAVYRRVYDTLLADQEVVADPRISSILNTQLQTLKPGSMNENAWHLRYGFDAVLALSGEAVAVFKPEVGVSPEVVRSLTPLTSAATVAVFRAVNDGVMGGVSSGGLQFLPEQKCAAFQGTVRTENNGGFSSIRYQGDLPNVSQYAGLYIECKAHDGNKVYTVVVKDLAAVLTSVVFKAQFQAPVGEFGRVLIPFSGFSSPERFGRPVSRPPMDWAALAEIGLMVLKPDVGDFKLLIKDIGVYK
eukprot:EG_transcript_10542